MKKNYPYKNFSEAIDLIDKESDRLAQQWHKDKVRASLLGALVGMTTIFFREYYRRGHKKNGVPGLFFSVNEGMKHFLTYAKYWELKKGDHK